MEAAPIISYGGPSGLEVVTRKARTILLAFGPLLKKGGHALGLFKAAKQVTKCGSDKVTEGNTY